MNKNHLLIGFMFIFLFSACGTTNKTQDAKSPTADAVTFETVVLKSDVPSPRKEMKATMGSTAINVIYGSPSVKGRSVWGGLVPFGKVWRAGANEATSIEVSSDVLIEGQKLAAGKYGFFAIPSDGEWTIVFNSVHDQWGAYDYDDSKDVLRVTVQPKTVGVHSETMEFAMEGSSLVLKWEKLAVPVKIKG